MCTSLLFGHKATTTEGDKYITIFPRRNSNQIQNRNEITQTGYQNNQTSYKSLIDD